jgi:general secretion pathway protein F
MPTFRYRALTQSGEMVAGSITAPTAGEVAQRIEYLGLLPIDTVVDAAAPGVSRRRFALWVAPRAEDVTVLTRDLALLLRAGVRINDGLEFLAHDGDVGRLRPALTQISANLLAGESFAEAIARFPELFPPIYVALVRVGEVSGSLGEVLEVLSAERARAEALRRLLADALRYPAFVLLAAASVLSFFLFFVLPQFASVLRDFNAKLDPMVEALLRLSDFVRAHAEALGVTSIIGLASALILLRRQSVRGKLLRLVGRMPLIRQVLTYYRTALFCRNIGVLLSSGVALINALRILSDVMASAADSSAWTRTVDRVRQGGKLSDALADTAALPAMAVRMLRLGEETGQLPMLAGRVAEFYEVKLQRSLDRVVGIAGPLAIISISIVVGGLIVSVMTALLSVSQIVG